MRVALEIRTSLRPERPGTTPEGEAGSKTEGERERGGARALTTRTSLRPEESEAKKGPESKEGTRETQRGGKQERDTKSQNTEEPRREKSERRKGRG